MSAIERLIVACSFIKMAIKIGIAIGFSTMISVIFELSNSFASAKSTAIKGKSQESFQSLGGKRFATKTSEKKRGMQLFGLNNWSIILGATTFLSIILWILLLFETKTHKRVRFILVNLWQSCEEETTSGVNFERAPVNLKVTSATSITRPQNPPETGT